MTDEDRVTVGELNRRLDRLPEQITEAVMAQVGAHFAAQRVINAILGTVGTIALSAIVALAFKV